MNGAADPYQRHVSALPHDAGMTEPRRNDPKGSTTVRTPHAEALVAALDARDHAYTVIAPDVIEVRDLAPDDLGWLAAAAGVVVYEMVTRRDD
jgi:hypothetical protein